MLVAGLLLFSGIASAYCGIDEAVERQRVHAVNAQQSDDHGTTDECPGLPDLVKEDTKHGPQRESALALREATRRSETPALDAAAAIVRRAPLAESAFRRFPRLLNQCRG